MGGRGGGGRARGVRERRRSGSRQGQRKADQCVRRCSSLSVGKASGSPCAAMASLIMSCSGREGPGSCGRSGGPCWQRRRQSRGEGCWAGLLRAPGPPACGELYATCMHEPVPLA